MFLSPDLIKLSFTLIGDIDAGSTGKARQEKVSALRYLLATSELMKSLGQSSIDLSPTAISNRSEFKKAVARITRIGRTNKYTTDFSTKFEVNIDTSVSSNFLTTRLEKSRHATEQGEYPGRYGALLLLLCEQVKISPSVQDNLILGYNFKKIKIPLTFWLLRETDFDLENKPTATTAQLSFLIRTEIKNRFEEQVSSSLSPSEKELDEFFNTHNINIKDIYSSELPDIDSIANTTETNQIFTSSLRDFYKSYLNNLDQANLTLDSKLVLRLLAAILTKRFCILTGLAGSGKTKLAEAFAMWICESPDQYRIVAVGADWTSNENLLGYADALQAGQYRAPVNGALELLLRAHADKEKPYFLVLDEMNLSHVERYFADFLSAMESDNAPLSLHGVEAGLVMEGAHVPAKLPMPDNLFIIGTVNVDETTYMFSPKVLDRANVIEFRATKDQMAAFLDNPMGVDLKALEKQGVPFAAAFLAQAKADTDVATLADKDGHSLSAQLKSDLIAVFSEMESAGAEFGFRTAKEIARFMVIHKELSGDGWVYKDALDAQVLQKLMPKLHGSARKLEGVLKALADFAAETNRDLPLTREKIKRMQSRLQRDGFTSFAEA